MLQVFGTTVTVFKLTEDGSLSLVTTQMQQFIQEESESHDQRQPSAERQTERKELNEKVIVFHSFFLSVH